MKLLFLITAAVISLLIVVTYFRATGSERLLTKEVRKNLPGTYIEIDQGVIHYNWHGPEDGPVLVMVHGFSTPQFVFDKNVPAFAQAGYRVLTFDHFGRGYSDRPEARYDVDFFDKEMTDLFAALKISTPVSLLGYSLGGGIATVFTARHPEKVKELVLIAPVGFMDEPSGQKALLMVPVLGEYLFSVIGINSLINEFRVDEQNGIATKRMVKLYTEQFGYKGAWNAMLSTMRHYPMHDLLSYYEKTGQLQKPVTLIWGTADGTVPYSGAKEVIKAIPHADQLILSDASHSLVYSHPKIVNDTIVRVLGD